MNEPVKHLHVAGEDRAHFELTKAIVTRRLEERVEWLQGLLDETCWSFEQITAAWTRAAELFPQKIGSILQGHFDGVPGGPDALLVRAQLLVWHKSRWPFDAAVIARDTDGQPSRREGARQALADVERRVGLQRPIVFAHPDPEAEAWFVAGFQPESEKERQLLADERTRLGYDPTRAPQRLTSKRQSDSADAKPVCSTLTGGSAERRSRCCSDLPLAAWTERAAEAGLADFLRDIDEKIVPAMGGDTR